MMAEEMMIFEVGDRFATITPAGKVTVWQVDLNGKLFEERYPLPPVRDVERTSDIEPRHD